MAKTYTPIEAVAPTGNEKVDLSVDIKQSTGDYFPTVYLDFMDISYGRLPDWDADEDAEEPSYQYARYSMNPETGTHINGSLSLYFTKEASENIDDLRQWMYTNLSRMYVYTFLCPYDFINQKVERGVLSAKELFSAMRPGTKELFNSKHSAYAAIMSEMKEAFFTNVWQDTSEWRVPPGGVKDSDFEIYDRAYFESRIDIYRSRWLYTDRS